MKKRKLLFDKKSKFGKWLRNFHRGKLERMNNMLVEIVLSGNPTTDYSFDPNTGIINLAGGDGKFIEGVIEVPKECMKDFGTMGGDKVSPEASDRDKWFESPNAEGYLDM